MTDPQQKPPELSNDDKTKAEYCLKLAERASGRIHHRRTIEWQVAIGIWTAFGAVTGFIITSSTWTTPLTAALLGTFLAVLVIGFYWIFWLRKYMRHVTAADQQRAVNWESEAITLLGISKPEPPPRDQYVWRGLHIGQWTQLVVAALFALLFIGALWSKMGSALGGKPSRMTIEGGSLEVDSMKFKSGGEQKP
jgi:hypothetical protein